MTKVLADALVPIFAGLLLGYIAGLRRGMDNKNVATLITFVMSFAVPSALFLAMADTPWVALRAQAPAALVLAIVYVLIFGLSLFLARYVAGLSIPSSAVVALTLGFPNSAAVGLPLLSSVFGSHSTVTVAISLAVGSITISPITLAILEAGRRGSGAHLTLNSFSMPLLRSLQKPIVWAPLLGLAISIAGLKIPSFAGRSLTVMGSSADGSALVLTGLVVSAQRFEIDGKTWIAMLLKNGLQPAMALGVGMLIHLSLEQLRYVTLISAMPCGFFGIVFGQGSGACPKTASSGLIASYAAGIATLAAWIVIVNHLQ